MTPKLTETDLLGMPLIDREKQCNRVVNWLIEVVNVAKERQSECNVANDPSLRKRKLCGVKAITPCSFANYYHLLPRPNETHEF
jgi:hypothetical protein